MAFGTAPHRIGSDWYTRSGRKLNAKGQHYWDTEYRLGNVTLDGHYNHQHAALTHQARSAPTRTQRVAAGRAVGVADKAQQDKLMGQAKLGTSIATLGASELVGAAGSDLVNSIKTRHPTLRASKKLGKEWVTEPIGTAIHHPSAKNIAFGGLAAAGVLPVGRVAKDISLGAEAIRAGTKAERAAKIERAGLKGHHALVAGDAVGQLGPVQGLARPVAKIAAGVSYSRPYAKVIGAHARVAKAMGRHNVSDALRIKAENAIHLRRISKLKGSKDVAHYWWAQMSPAHRNASGLQHVVNRLHTEEHYIRSGHALDDLRADLEEVNHELTQVQFGSPEYYDWISQRGAIQNRIRDLPHAADALANSAGVIKKAIKDNPTYDPRVIESLKVLEKDRRDIGVASGKLDAAAAAERPKLVMDWLGLNPSGEEVYMGHRLGIENKPPEGLIPRSPGGGRVKLPRGWSSKNERVLLNTGRLHQTTHTAIEDWQAAHTFRSTVRARNETGLMGKDYTGGPVDWEKYHLINPKGKVIPPGWKVDQLGKLKDAGFDQEEIRKIADESLKTWMIDNQQALDELVTLNHGEPIPGLRVVRKEDLNRYFAQMGAGTASKAERVYDQAVSAVMMQLIFARVGYIPKNLLQNAIMIVPHQGLMVAVNMPRAAQLAPVFRGAVRKQSDLDRQVWDLLQNAHGSGGATAGAVAGLGGIGGRVTHKVAGGITSVADAIPRTSAVIHELAKKGVISKFNPVLTEQEKRGIIEFFKTHGPDVRDVEQASKDAMGDFNRLAPNQRRWLRRLLIVPNWLVAGTRYPVHFSLNHPIKAGAIGAAAYYGFGGPGMPTGGKPPLRLAKGVPPWAVGLETSHGVLRLASLIPASIPGDIALAASQGRWIDATSYANPLLVAMGMIIAGYEPHPTYAKKVGITKSIWANAKRLAPNFKLYMDLAHRQGSTTYPDDTSIIGRLRREAGVFPIRVSREGGGHGNKKDTGLGGGNYDFGSGGGDLGKGNYDFSK